MFRRTHVFALSSLLACASPGATSSEALESGPPDSPAVVVVSRAAPDLFLRQHDAVTRLGHVALASGLAAQPGAWLASPRATQLAQDDNGRQALSELVACALPAGWEVDVQVGDATIPVLGEVGLAPAWVVWPLDPAGRRWVSACVEARLASDAVASVVSLRGPHPALSADGDERAAWSVQEGALWGDLFTPVGASPAWAACRGEGWVTAPTASGLVDRGCTRPDPAHSGRTLCGMVDAGTCATACRAQHGGAYRGCATPGVASGLEVVTSYVLP